MKLENNKACNKTIYQPYVGNGFHCFIQIDLVLFLKSDMDL